MWRERLESTPAFSEDWIEHQRLDDFWRQGSVCEDWGAIEVPVLAFGGWTDAYTDGVLELLEHLEYVRKGIIGPWGHMFPEQGIPGPEIGFLQECVRWWDRWLKGVENGVEREPMLRAWLQEPVRPAGQHAELPGRWIAEETWPSSRVKPQAMMLSVGGRPGATIEIEGVQSCGETAGVWCANGLPDELPLDQSRDDERSFCFDFAPLDERLDLLGSPVVRLELASNQPLALIAVRLCDVWPDGTSSLVSWGELNLTHRESDDEPAPLRPGHACAVRLRLKPAGYTVLPGHRLRLALSPTYWPHAWPSPVAAELTIAVDGPSVLVLPTRDGSEAAEGHGASFEPAEISAPLGQPITHTSARKRRIDTVPGSEQHRIHDHEEQVFRIAATSSAYRIVHDDEYTITDGEPLSAHVACVREYSMDRDGWSWRVRTESEQSSDERSFHLTNTVEAWDGVTKTFSSTRRKEIPRELV
jgi:hypothetical protein